MRTPIRITLDNGGEQVVLWAAQQLEIPGWNSDATSIGVFIDDCLAGAVVYEGFTPYECNMHLAVDDQRCITRAVIRQVFEYPFVQLDYHRVSGLVRADNEACIKFCERIGFTHEGRKREAVAGHDEVIMGMLRDECRWLA